MNFYSHKFYQPLIATFLAIYAVWLVLSGQDKMFLLSTGMILSFLVAYLSVAHLSQIASSWGFDARFIAFYLPWLLLQVFLSSLFVAKLAWKPSNIARDPKLNIFIIDNIKKNNILLTIFANSVTLTPGTATLLLEKDKTVVQCLDKDLLDGVYQIQNKIIKTLRQT